MSVPLEHIEALAAAGSTVEQLLALFRADRARTLRLRAEREARRANLNNAATVTGLESGSTGLVPASTAPEISIGGYQKSMARMAALGSIDLRPAAKLVMAVLVEHFNMKTGRCDPSLDLIARKTGLSARSVRRAVVELEHAGMLRRRIHGGRFHANSYELQWARFEGLAAAMPIVNKPDSDAANRTLMAAKPDRRVRQNESRKQFSPVVGERPRTRPDPAQRQMLFPINNPAAIAKAAAERRVIGDIDSRSKRQPSFNVSGLTPVQWEDVYAAEMHRQGAGMETILRLLGLEGETGPPAQTASTG